jgi:hypothetical protein
MASSADSATSGLLGRIVENWLTSASERSYQIPFCQMLDAEGETLLYVASHGAFEKGKDVITKTAEGQVRAYQLKAGDFSLATWREVKTQIDELVELPIILPSCEGLAAHFPYFVTNGRINDAVFDHINAANIGWQQRHLPHALQTLDRNQLVPRFVAVHGAYLPSEAKDFQKFLALLLRDGRAPLDKPTFSAFIESTLRLKEGHLSDRDTHRALASVVLLASYILGSSAVAGNHWALFEGWMIVASYVLAAATKLELKETFWKATFDLAMLGANRALDDLVAECTIRDQFIEGHPIADGFFYGSRQLILAGLLSAWMIRQRRANAEVDEQVKRIMLGRLKELFIWGESSVPFILLSALELEQQCLQLVGENLVRDYLNLLVLCNEPGNRGMPDSFVSVEESIRFMHRIGDQHKESYQGHSYTILVAIDFLARRWRRKALTLLWKDITYISFATSIPKQKWEWFMWEADSADLEHRLPGQPQSWQELMADAEGRDTSCLPELLLKHPEFALYFPLVFPHRLTPATFAVVDSL